MLFNSTITVVVGKKNSETFYPRVVGRIKTKGRRFRILASCDDKQRNDSSTNANTTTPRNDNNGAKCFDTTQSKTRTKRKTTNTQNSFFLRAAFAGLCVTGCSGFVTSTLTAYAAASKTSSSSTSAVSVKNSNKNNNNNNNNNNYNDNALRKEAANPFLNKLRRASKHTVKKSLDVTRACCEVIDDKINDPWNVEDVWAIFALRYVIRKRRAFFAWLLAKKAAALGQKEGKNEELVRLKGEDEVEYKKTFAYWIGKPLGVMCILWTASWIFDVSCEFIDALLLDYDIPQAISEGFDRGSYILSAGIIVSMWITRYGAHTFRKFFTDVEVDEGQLWILVRIANVFTLTCTCAATLLSFGLSTSLLFSFGGLGGLAFGLAAKDFIANLIGGVIIIATSPFRVGEDIILLGSGGKFRGSESPNISEYTVKEIGWYATTLMPRDCKPTVVPNGYFLGNATVNHSRASHRFLRATFQLRYEDVSQARKLRDVLIEYLKQHPQIDCETVRSTCLISGLGSEKLEFEIRMFIPFHLGVLAMYDVRTDVCLKVCEVLEAYAPKSAGTTPLLLSHDGSFDGILGREG